MYLQKFNISRTTHERKTHLLRYIRPILVERRIKPLMLSMKHNTLSMSSPMLLREQARLQTLSPADTSLSVLDSCTRYSFQPPSHKQRQELKLKLTKI